LGGDEFVVVLAGVVIQADCLRSIDRILSSLSKPIDLGDGNMAQISGSVGYTIYPEDDSDPDTLLRHADQAMYTSKQSGKNRAHQFDLKFDTRKKATWIALNRIENGLNQGEFQLYVQPKVDLRTGRVAGGEALIRWLHPIRGLVPPMEFLPLIENHDLSLRVDEWVIREGLILLDDWCKQGLDISLSVNVGARKLRDKDFPKQLAILLKDFPNISPDNFELEIVESVALDDLKAVSTLIDECRTYGLRFSLDDFGTGYSSLTYLKKLEVNTLKIDQTFVRDMLEDESDMAIVRGIIGLAKAFQRETVAEGVETWPHAWQLKQLGCDLIQGYAIARPMPSIDIPSWIDHFKLPEVNS
jgi:EAL domain-containing protein (putative c-di-GMP-specific phosphodiesterase class I)